MKRSKLILLFISHLIAGAIGFAVGIYALPILIAPSSPSASEIEQMSKQASFTAEFKRDLKGSDFLHWGEGTVSISQNHISLSGELAPGPDYKLYLSPVFVENEEEFESQKSSMSEVGDIKTFKNFIIEIDSNTNLLQYNTVVVWCESFGEFITSAKYR
ncbi:MAG: DM13 domain-containing protein [Marinicellaceae bacterium]